MGPKSLAEALADFDENTAMSLVEQRLEAGDSPLELVKELQAGMQMVGERFNSGDYYLSELMMSADLFTRIMELVEPALKGAAPETVGRMVIGTPKGDIHDLGKNIFSTVAKGAGFEVIDLGIDVPADRFITAVAEHRPRILGMSALITTSFQTMKQIVDGLTEKGLRDQVKIIIGGGVTTETVKNHVGADAQTIDAMEGLRICRQFLGL